MKFLVFEYLFFGYSSNYITYIGVVLVIISIIPIKLHIYYSHQEAEINKDYEVISDLDENESDSGEII